MNAKVLFNIKRAEKWTYNIQYEEQNGFEEYS